MWEKDWVMICKIKIIIFVFLVFFIESVHCQNTLVKTIFDVDSIPALNTYPRSGQPDSIVYIKYDGKRIRVNFDIKFVGGWESLNAFCDSLYYNRKDYNNQEIDAYYIYSVLFDEKLHIQEIRIYKGVQNLKGTYNYNGLVKKILNQTAGKWKLNDTKTKNWFLYFGSHRFY